ncbi:MAG: hypothetical protein ACOYMF_16585 [Bacteroidales bacterium]
MNTNYEKAVTTLTVTRWTMALHATLCGAHVTFNYSPIISSHSHQFFRRKWRCNLGADFNLLIACLPE